MTFMEGYVVQPKGGGEGILSWGIGVIKIVEVALCV